MKVYIGILAVSEELNLNRDFLSSKTEYNYLNLINYISSLKCLCINLCNLRFRSQRSNGTFFAIQDARTCSHKQGSLPQNGKRLYCCKVNIYGIIYRFKSSWSSEDSKWYRPILSIKPRVTTVSTIMIGYEEAKHLTCRCWELDLADISCRISYTWGFLYSIMSSIYWS